MLHRLLREPLLHFVVLGALLFVVYTALNPPEAEADTNRIDVTTEMAGQLVEQFRQAWRRPPTEQELQGLIDSHVREEILVREAAALSMDQNDTVIRRRLAQKMQFLLEAAAGAQVPTEDDLRTYFAENSDRYATPPALAFEQVLIGQQSTEAEIEAVVAALRSGADPAGQGARTLLPPVMGLSRSQEVDGQFGAGVFAQLNALPVGEWVGPVASGYGLHVVLVTQAVPSAVPEFDAVRDRVAEDWQATNTERGVDAILTEMRAGYEVSQPDGSVLAELAQ